jgi:hypothetical protein
MLSACGGDGPSVRRPPGRTDAGADGDAPPPTFPDADGDGISDFYEDRDAGVDTDGDGVPDYLDLDSDDDGIPDAVERNAPPGLQPGDADGDGIPDFRDSDSDANGIPDSREGGDDLDSDGRPNSSDFDNDGDTVSDRDEIGANPGLPLDTDRDGTPDYMDFDSDGDFIADRDEALPVDTDGDTIPDRLDTDTDNDGFSDAEEAGDTDLNTPPVDTDGDTIPDFRDPDSDNDGLSDADERRYGTNPRAGDSDGDGVPDLIEVGAGTNPTDGSDSPRTRGNFVFVVPYEEAPDPPRDTLQFSTTLRRADVYFLMDNTGSMSGTIRALQMGLTGTVIPMVRAAIPEAWFGVGGFDDYPIGRYGTPGCGSDSAGIPHDMAFFQYQIMTSNDVDAQNAVNIYRTNCGADGPESGLAALYALATRDALGGYARFRSAGMPVTSTPPACPPGHTGAACFRPDAVPIIVMMTDVCQHNDPTCSAPYDGSVPGGGPSWAATMSALAAINARVVGIDTSGGARTSLTRFVQETTIARGATGAASDYVISAPGGSGLSSAVTTAIQRASLVPLDVSARAVDDPGDTVNAVAAFISHLETNATGAPGRTCTGGFATVDRPGIDDDTFPDTFQRVTPGSPVCFDIVAKTNTTVTPTTSPQVFRARIEVVGDGFTPLDARDVFFLVPPRIEIPMMPPIL